VGQLAPLLLQLAFGLLPVSCDAVPVHGFPFSVMRCPLYRRAGSRYAAERRRQAWLKTRKEATYLPLGRLHVFVKNNYDPGPEFGTRKFSGARMRNGRSRVLMWSCALYSSYHGPMALPVELLHGISREAINELAVRRYEGEVRLVATAGDLERAAADFAAERVVGFDTETRPAFRVGQS